MTAPAPDLRAMPLDDLKALHRNLTNRWMDEEAAPVDDRERCCLNDGCENRCLGFNCVACIDAQRRAVNAEMGRRNRELAKTDDADDGDDAAPDATAPPSIRTCEACGNRMRKDNKFPTCLNCRTHAKVGPAESPKGQATPRQTTPRPIVERPGGEDSLRSFLVGERDRLAAQREETTRLIDAINVVLGMVG